MAILNKKSRSALYDPLVKTNPISLSVLGICSALAVTIRVDQALIMTGAVIFVLSASNTIISVIRKYIPSRTRIIIQLAIIAGLVSLIDQVLMAYMYDMSKQLSVFVSLIVTNCIVMGRADAYAMQNPAGNSFLDGLGNGFWYGAILIAVAFFRELFGSGTIYGISMIPDFVYNLGYENLGLMVLSPGAFIVLGLIVWFQKEIWKEKVK